MWCPGRCCVFHSHLNFRLISVLASLYDMEEMLQKTTACFDKLVSIFITCNFKTYRDPLEWHFITLSENIELFLELSNGNIWGSLLQWLKCRLGIYEKHSVLFPIFLYHNLCWGSVGLQSCSVVVWAQFSKWNGKRGWGTIWIAKVSST